jgi:L-fuconolactonase
MVAIPMPDNGEWLAKVKEDIIEPDLPIIDPHHHLWDHPGNRYVLDQFLADIGTLDGTGHNIRATVFAECFEMYRTTGPEHLRPVGETEFINGIAAQSASGRFGPTRVAAGIFSFADLSLGSKVGETLDAHMAHAPDRFRGIRYMTAHDDTDVFGTGQPWPGPAKGLLLEPKVREGAKELIKRGLTFDSFFFHPQLPDLISFARALPDLPIVLDHLGAPLGKGIYKGKRKEIFEQWKLQMAELAKCENVHAKLGGLCMVFTGYEFESQPKPPTSDELLSLQQDWYRFMLDKFGPDRCMFESNFPVDKFGVSYNVLWNFFKKLTKDLSAGERTDLFHDTAARFYRIEPV